MKVGLSDDTRVTPTPSGACATSQMSVVTRQCPI